MTNSASTTEAQDRSVPCAAKTEFSHQILGHRRVVPRQSKSMTARGNRSVDDLDRLGHNRAGEIEILDPVRGRRDSEHVSASLGKQMARHGNGGGLRLSGYAEPTGDAANLH